MKVKASRMMEVFFFKNHLWGKGSLFLVGSREHLSSGLEDFHFLKTRFCGEEL